MIMAEPDSKQEAYFVWPPEEDDINIPKAGLIKIDFGSGKVEGKGQSGKALPQLQGSLEGLHRKSIRSIHIETDRKVRFYTDVGSNKNLIPINANDIWETELQPFKILYIRVLTANTRLVVIGSTSLVGFKPIMVRSPSTVDSGNKNVTAAGTAVPLSSTSIPCQAVDVSAKRTNAGIIYVGGSGVSSSNGRWLYPGDAVSLNIRDVNATYIDAAVSGEGVTFLYTV